MEQYRIHRQQVLDVIRDELEPLDFTHALWEAGAASFGRVDDWSDIDLVVDVDDDHVEETFRHVEQALERLTQIDLRYEIPQPSFFGIAQTFYRLKDASPYLLLDLAVIQHSNPNKLLEPEIHGHARVLFDKLGIVTSSRLDWAEVQDKVKARLTTLLTTFDLWQVLVLKEINRGNTIEALAFYHSFTLRPLVEALRIRHLPARYNFYTRYIHYDLPAEIVGRLEQLFFVAGVQDLIEKHRVAQDWMHQLMGEPD